MLDQHDDRQKHDQLCTLYSFKRTTSDDSVKLFSEKCRFKQWLTIVIGQQHQAKAKPQDLVQRDNKVVSLDLNAHKNGGPLLGMNIKWYSSSIYQCWTGKKTEGKQTEHLKQDLDEKVMEEYLFSQ